MNEPVIRRSEACDRAELIALWHEVFGDELSYIEEFFRCLYRPEEAVVAVLDGAVAAAGYCLSGASAAGHPCSYIYAVATYPAARGRGLGAAVIKALCENAFADGADIVATLPASESLCPWYEGLLDMQPVFLRGGEGVEFSPQWRAFAAFSGEGSEPEAPERLRAVARPGLDLAPLRSLGWKLTLE